MSTSKPSSRASVRTEVQPSLGPSGLTIQASPTGMSIPRGDYRPQVSADNQLIANAFARLSMVASDVAREELQKRADEDQALGIQTRLQAGDNADRAIDTEGKSEFFIKGYDLMQGRLGAAQAGADLKAAYDQNPDAFPTQGSLSKMIAGRIEQDLKGVESPEMRAAYLHGMVDVEADITAKNATYQAMVAHTNQVNSFAATAAASFSNGLDAKSTEDLVVEKNALMELGKVNGLSHDEINTTLVKVIGERAIDQGRPELMDVFGWATPTEDGKSVPGLTNSGKYRDSIRDYRHKAQSAKDAFEASQKESRQDALNQAIEAEPDAGKALQMIKDGVDNHLLTAEQAATHRKNLNKRREESLIHDAFSTVFASRSWATAQAMVDNGLVKQEELNKALDKYNVNNLTFFHQYAGNPATANEAARALRNVVDTTRGTGRKSKVLERELNPSVSDPAAFQSSLDVYKAMRQQGPEGIAAAESHVGDDMKNRIRVYESILSQSRDPNAAYQAAVSYGTPDAIKRGDEGMGKVGTKTLNETISDELESYDPWGPTNYDMQLSPEQRQMIKDDVRVAQTESGFMLDPAEISKSAAERFKATHVPYKTDSMEKGVYVKMPFGADPDKFKETMDWYAGSVISAAGLPAGTELYPEYQDGIGYVMRDAANHRVITRTGADKNGNPITVPVIVPDMYELMNKHTAAQHMSAEEAMMAQRTAQPQDMGLRGRGYQDWQKQMNAARRSIEYARQPLTEDLQPAKNRRGRRGRTPMTDLQTAPAAGPQAQQEAPAVQAEGTSDWLANMENAQRAGWDNGTGKWTPHGSPEGGNPTLAYGHKITKAESASGVIEIGGEKVKYADGITESQAKQLFKQDTAIARSAVESLVKVPLNADQKEALISLVYNVGVPSFKGSNALKALNKGDMETFRLEAFGERGWINYKGHPGGLKSRRAQEEQKFFGK